MTERVWVRPAVVLGGVVLAGVTALGLAACGVPTDRDYQPVAATNVPFGLLDTTTTSTTTTTLPPATTTTTIAPTTTTTAVPTDPVNLYFVDEGRLRPVVREVVRPVELDQVIRLLQAGPVEPDEPRGLRSSLVEGAIEGVSLSQGIATVDLGRPVSDLTGNEQVLAIAQIVLTLTDRAGVGQVQFTIDGRPVAVPRGNGSLTGAPVPADVYRNLLALDVLAQLPTTTTTTTTTAIGEPRAEVSGAGAGQVRPTP